MTKLHPGRAAVVALAGARRHFHLAQQGVHLGDRQDAAGADGVVAGDGRGDMGELVAEAERSAELGDFPREVGEKAGSVRLAERGGNGPGDGVRSARRLLDLDLDLAGIGPPGDLAARRLEELGLRVRSPGRDSFVAIRPCSTST